MKLERIGLVGVGVTHLLTTHGGRRLGVVSHLDGRRELAIYDPEEPDRAVGAVALKPVEARAVADVLDAE
jgi:TrkA domain protein